MVPIRFGWRQHTPLKPVVQVPSADQRSLDSVTKDLLSKLNRSSLDQPGFALINQWPGFQSREQIQDYCGRLFQQVADAWLKQHADPKTPEMTVARQTVHDGKHFCNHTPFQGPKGTYWTPKVPHFDLNPMLLGHLYFPPVNVTGGQFSVYDVPQALKDQANNHTFTHALKKQVHPHRLKDFTPSLQSGLSPYQKTLTFHQNQPMFVVVNNDHQRGVAHGASPASVTDPAKPFSRQYIRWSLTRKRPAVPNPL